MIFGFCLLGSMSMLALVIALGKVEEKTSYGLMFLLGSFSTMVGAFATWAFTSRARGRGINSEGEFADTPDTAPVAPPAKA